MTGCRSQRLRAVAIGYGRLLMTILVSVTTIAAVLVIGLSPRPAVSLPLYARQTGQPCATCHTAFLELTPFGRRFKLGGYTLDGGDGKGPPFAVMLQPTFTNTQSPQPGGAAPGFIMRPPRPAPITTPMDATGMQRLTMLLLGSSQPAGVVAADWGWGAPCWGCGRFFS